MIDALKRSLPVLAVLALLAGCATSSLVSQKANPTTSASPSGA